MTAAGTAVENDRGRVCRDGMATLGEYVAGWLKRGSTGVIGTNRADAMETVTTLLEDVERLRERPAPTVDLEDLLARRCAKVTGMDHWSRIDLAELELGRSLGRTRTTLHTRGLLLDAAGFCQTG
jgi:ferredoxin--NADP+ reductase